MNKEYKERRSQEVKKKVFDTVVKINEGFEERGFKTLCTILHSPEIRFPDGEVDEVNPIEENIKLNFNIENKARPKNTIIFSLEIYVGHNGTDTCTSLYLELDEDDMVRDFDDDIDDLIEFIIGEDI